MAKRPMYVYIMTTQRDTVLYTGVTNDLIRRVEQHRAGEGGGFTSRYRCAKLVYCEEVTGPAEAIAREKQIKAGSRQDKIDLIGSQNPRWRDLYDEITAGELPQTDLPPP